ncbi:hypothetical protein D3C87_263310 [compost metagenome]
MKKIILLLILVNFNLYSQAPKENEKLQLKIDLLQKKVDSLNQTQILDKAQFRIERELEIVNQVSGFFNYSVGIIILLFAAVGVLTPVLINWYQNKLVKNANDQLLLEYKKSISLLDEKFNEKNDELINSFNEKIQSLNDQLDIKTAEFSKINSIIRHTQTALIFFSQAQSNMLEKNYVKVLYNLVLAIHYWEKNESYFECGYSIDTMVTYIRKMRKSDFNELNRLISNNTTFTLNFYDIVKNYSLNESLEERIRNQAAQIEGIISNLPN